MLSPSVVSLCYPFASMRCSFASLGFGLRVFVVVFHLFVVVSRLFIVWVPSRSVKKSLHVIDLCTCGPSFCAHTQTHIHTLVCVRHPASYVCPVGPALTSLPDCVTSCQPCRMDKVSPWRWRSCDPCSLHHQPRNFHQWSSRPLRLPPAHRPATHSTHPPSVARKGPPAEALPAGQTLRPAKHKGWVNSSFAFLSGPTLHAEAGTNAGRIPGLHRGAINSSDQQGNNAHSWGEWHAGMYRQIMRMSSITGGEMEAWPLKHNICDMSARWEKFNFKSLIYKHIYSSNTRQHTHTEVIYGTSPPPQKIRR